MINLVWFITQERIWNLKWLKVWIMHTHPFKSHQSQSEKKTHLSLFIFSFITSTTASEHFREKKNIWSDFIYCFVEVSSLQHLGYYFFLCYFPLRFGKIFPSQRETVLPIALSLVYLYCDVSKTPQSGSSREQAALPFSSPATVTQKCYTWPSGVWSPIHDFNCYYNDYIYDWK